ncbi:MAG: bacillithiol biosynthesis cysteine-adding enzyme BshC, partial [Bacteroidota bacterium]
LCALLKNICDRYPTYGQAMQALVHQLFGQEGLVVLNMDEPSLKRAFIPHLRRELFDRPSQALVEEATKELEAAGFSGQAFPREINLFYLTDQSRERIVLENGRFSVLNTDLSWSEAEMEKELEQHPECFSPNVVMRPLYQEAILPNLAYIGGGGEIAYWLERKAQFELFGLNFPMLVRRNSVLWIDKGSSKKINKLGLEIADLFVETETLVKQFVKNQSEHELNFQAETQQLQSLFTQIVDKVKTVDPTLVRTVKAEEANQMKSFKQLEGRILKAEKQRFEVSLNQIRGLKEKLFPNQGLQERHDNFMPFYLKHGDDYLQTLIEVLDPLKKALIILQE